MLNKTHLLNKNNRIWNYDWQLIVVTVVLCIFGLVFLASALSGNPQIDSGRYWPELAKQLIAGIGFGGILTFLLAKTDYHRFIKQRNLFIWITLILLFFVSFLSVISFVTRQDASTLYEFMRPFPVRPAYVNGAARWIKLPFGLPDLQPSEIAKITVLIFFAGVLSRFGNQEITMKRIKQPLWVLFSVLFLIFVQPDLGNTVVISMIVVSALWVAGFSAKTLAKILIFVALFGLSSIFLTPYRRQRISSVPAQVTFIQNALANGGLTGKGYGNSELKQYGKIYEANTDGIIGVIGEELGLVGILALLMLYVYLFYRGMKIASEAMDLEGQIIATGITVWIGMQVFMNIGGMTGILPAKGLPLPFISQGGTAIVMNLISIGLLLNISSQKKKELKPKKTITV
jgi:cell division protein FtsW (lipid II flippase)